MPENKQTWNSHEFRIYLLLYAANADFELKVEEKQLILSIAKKAEYQHIHKIFESDSDFKRIETILSYRERYFPTDEDIERLLKEIMLLLKSDKEYNLYERNFIGMLHKLLRK
jgi:hypothetical protein